MLWRAKDYGLKRNQKGDLIVNEREIVQQIYEKFKEDCDRNTMQVMAFLGFLRDEGVLHHLVGMDHLTMLEMKLIENLLSETSQCCEN